MTDDTPDADERSESRLGRTNRIARRRCLQALGAAGLLGVGTDAVAAADGEDADPPTGEVVAVTEADEDNWEAAADERIREHRTAEFAVSVADTDGEAVDADVAVEMREHAYGFGSAINAGTLVEETEPGDEYREYAEKLFNKAVLENHHKWRFWEAETELADAATEWILDRGLDLRGHVCLWANVSAWAVPPDVVRAMGMTWEANDVTDPDLDPNYVRERTFEHVREIIEHYGDDIVEWEVHNETIHRPEFVEAINGIDPDEGKLDVPAVEAPVLAEWYEAARDAAPEGVPLAINDYNVLVGPYEDTREAYVDEMTFLNDRGVELGGVGLQCHFAEDEALTPAQTLRGLNRYAQHESGLQVTEFDTADPDWSPEAKGEFLYRFLKTVYSHPATEDFLLWGFWDGRHWKDDAPLFFEDWSKKPAYEAYTDLVFDQWWTDASGSTGDDGRFVARAFLGDHDLRLSLDGGTLSVDVSVEEPVDREVCVLVVDVDVLGDGSENGVVPVEIEAGDAFDPADLDLDTVRFGAADAVAAGDGAPAKHGEHEAAGGGGDRDRVLHFDAGAYEREGSTAALRGETEDGALVVGFAD